MCHPELWLNFNDRDIQDASGYQMPVGNNGNVVNVSNAGRFDGTGTLTVWQYSNQDLGTELTVNLRFYEFEGGVSEEQVTAYLGQLIRFGHLSHKQGVITQGNPESPNQNIVTYELDIPGTDLM